MRAWSVTGLLFTAAIIATMPIAPQVTPLGVGLSVNQAQAITYGHHRRATVAATTATTVSPLITTAAIRRSAAAAANGTPGSLSRLQRSRTFHHP
jgi:hypothetical protein